MALAEFISKRIPIAVVLRSRRHVTRSGCLIVYSMDTKPP